MAAGCGYAMTPALCLLRQVLRHPALILGVYILRLLAAIGLTWNWAKMLGTDSVMAYPQKDSELFAPGAALLLRTIAEQEQAISRRLGCDLLLVIGLAVAGSAFSTVALCALTERQGSSEPIQIRNSLRMMPTTLAISVVYWLSLTAVFFFAKTLYLLIPATVYPMLGERGSDIAIVLLAIVVLVATFIAFVASDLARAIAVQSNRGTLDAIAHSINCLKGRLGKCLMGAAFWTAPAVVAPAIVEYTLASIGLHGATRTMALLLAHQLTILALCVFHLCWWSNAIELVRGIPTQMQELSPAGND